MLPIVTFIALIVSIIFTIKMRDKTLLKFSIILAVICMTQCLRYVPTNRVAVTQVLGFTSERVLSSGLYLTNPIRKLTLFSTQIQRIDHAISSISKEGHSVSFQMGVAYQIMPQDVILLFQRIGPDFVDTLIKPELEAALRQIAAQYSVDELKFMDDKIAAMLMESVSTSLKDRGIEIKTIEVKL